MAARLACVIIAVIACGAVPAHAAAVRTATPAASLRDGAAKYAAGRVREAEEIFMRIIQQTPKDPHAWLWLGVVRYRQRNHSGAAAAFESAARLAPRDAKIQIWRAHLLQRLGQGAEARAAFEHVRVISNNPYVRQLAEQALRSLQPAPALPAGQETNGQTAGQGWALTIQGYSDLARHYNPRLRRDEADAIAQSLLTFSRWYNLDPRLVVALIVVESGFQPRARSRAGAMGLGQLMPGTARALGVDPYDPAQNLYGTIRYLRGNLDRFGWDNLHLALAAYNAGRGAVERYEGIPPYDETRWYVYNVSTLYRRLLSL
ncbi:MAG TPA: transglycosylase SLT domain-containing protein [bacterium]|nr:transglycosylase SLT domain-containing protein [bacterium]